MTRREPANPPTGTERALLARGTLADRSELLGKLMLAPALAYVALLVGVPFLLAIALSFSDATAGSLRFGWAGFRNYAAILSDPVFRRALKDPLASTTR